MVAGPDCTQQRVSMLAQPGLPAPTSNRLHMSAAAQALLVTTPPQHTRQLLWQACVIHTLLLWGAQQQLPQTQVPPVQASSAPTHPDQPPSPITAAAPLHTHLMKGDLQSASSMGCGSMFLPDSRTSVSLARPG